MDNWAAVKIKQLKQRIQFAAYCFPKGDDTRFVNNVKQIGKEPEIVMLERTEGEATADCLYHIYMEESHSGFFADHNRLLAYLYFADYYHLTPVVEYTDKFCYAEKNPVNGKTNPFEYFFQQPSGFGVEALKSARVCFRSRKENTILANRINDKMEGYTKTDAYLREMARITAKYIRLQLQTQQFIEEGIADIMSGKKVLGVHVRGTDFMRNYNGHPVTVTTQEFLQKTEALVQKKGYDQVFLATDDTNAVEIFEKAFGDCMVYYKEVVRSAGNETVMKSESSRENHHYKLGLEVLRDMYTLARCDGLIAGLSQVSYAARIQKMSEGKEFEDLSILDKGINYHRARNCS